MKKNIFVYLFTALIINSCSKESEQDPSIENLYQKYNLEKIDDQTKIDKNALHFESAEEVDEFLNHVKNNPEKVLDYVKKKRPLLYDEFLESQKEKLENDTSNKITSTSKATGIGIIRGPMNGGITALQSVLTYNQVSAHSSVYVSHVTTLTGVTLGVKYKTLTTLNNQYSIAHKIHYQIVGQYSLVLFYEGVGTVYTYSPQLIKIEYIAGVQGSGKMTNYIP